MKFLFGLFTFVLFLGVVSSAIWVNDPNNCPQEYQAQNCIPNKVCGFHGETTECASLSDMLLGAPSSTNSNTLYQSSLSGGFIFDCVYYGGTYPYCINSAACNRASECSTLNRWTECNDWGSYTCTTCVTGYQYCDGSYTDANGCEIQTGVTSRGTNVVYGTSCSYQCVSGYLDCDGDSTGSDGDCEIQVGVTSFTEANTVYLTCTTASCSSGFMACEGETATVDGCNYQIGASCTTGEGKPGTWQSGCVCQELAQEHFITNTEAKGWGDFLLFGKQYNPIGWLMNLTNSEGKSIAIDNESCIIFNDGSKMCGAGNITIGGGEIVNESNYSTYTTWWSNVSGFVSDWLIQTGDNLDFNQTKLDENYLRNDGDNASGRYNFDGAWSEGGVTIDSGEIFAQRLYVYNVTSLAINHLNINGSLIPENFDNTFDIGSSLLRWRDGYFGNDVYIDGQSVNDRLTSINFSGGNNEILMTNGFGSTKTNSNFKYDGTTNTLEITDGTNPSRISPGSLSFNSDNVIVSGSSGFTPQLGNFVQGSFYTWYNTANFITIGSTSSDIVDRSLLDIYLVDNNQANHLYFGTDGVFLSGYNSDNWDNDYLITKGYADATYGAGTSYTFSNGLTESGGSVSLGGALTGDTYIYGDRFTTDLFFGQTGGNEMNSINMYSSGNITLSSLGGSVLLSNAIYAADYSLGFVNRSLVDKEYVDTAVSSVGNFYTFSNGLTESGGSVSLGGNLTQDLFFTTTPSYSFNIQNNENNQQYFSFRENSFDVYLEDINTDYAESYLGTNTFWVDVYQNTLGYGSYLEMSPTQIYFDVETDLSAEATLIGGQGFVYGADYSLGFVNRSLVDKEYVDTAITAGIGSSGLVPYSGATQDVNLGNNNLFSNTINMSGDNVSLGEFSGFENIGNKVTFVGKSAGYNNSQDSVTTIGYESGYNNKGSGVTAVGYQAANLNQNKLLTAVGSQAGAENLGERVESFGIYAAAANIGNYVVSIGSNSGTWNEGNDSVFIGSLSGQLNKGNSNTFVGAYSGSSSEGNQNIGLGTFSANSVTGNFDIGIGYSSLLGNSGNYSIGLGADTLKNNIGNNVIAFGTRSGFQNTGNDTIFIGSDVGTDNSISGRLMIDIENTTTPLIDGDFILNNLKINGNLIVTENINVSGCINYNGGTLGTCI